MKVYFNGSCNICNAEINHYKKKTYDINYVDISKNKDVLEERTIINDFESNLYQGVVMKLEIDTEIENIKKNINSIRRYL